MNLQNVFFTKKLIQMHKRKYMEVEFFHINECHVNDVY